MYLLTWNPKEHQIEASFGGRITRREAIHFAEEFLAIMDQHTEFQVLIDFSTITGMTDCARDILDDCRESAIYSGAEKVTFITRDEREARRMTEQRLQQVMDGRERYISYALTG